MYDLPSFKGDNFDEVFDFMLQHPFIFISGVDDDSKPVATQIPVLIKKIEGKIILQGHMMRKQKHHIAFEKNNQILAAFIGPQSYISATCYTNQKTASTWNYMTVHAHGKMVFKDEFFLRNLLDELTYHFENDAESVSLYKNLHEEYIAPMLKAIVGFEIEVEQLENVFKLSQNKDKSSYERIISFLENKSDCESHTLANEMKKRKNKLFNS